MLAGFMEGRSTIVGATVWMFALSFLLMLLLGWIPIIGPFIGPSIGGYIGGRRAGTITRALLAALLPAGILSLLILGAGAAATAMTGVPGVGALALAAAGASGLVFVIHNAVLFGAAIVGGLSAQADE